MIEAGSVVMAASAQRHGHRPDIDRPPGPQAALEPAGHLLDQQRNFCLTGNPQLIDERIGILIADAGLLEIVPVEHRPHQRSFAVESGAAQHCGGHRQVAVRNALEQVLTHLFRPGPPFQEEGCHPQQLG